MLGAERYRDLSRVGGVESSLSFSFNQVETYGSERSISPVDAELAISYRKIIECDSFIVELLSDRHFLPDGNKKSPSARFVVSCNCRLFLLPPRLSRLERLCLYSNNSTLIRETQSVGLTGEKKRDDTVMISLSLHVTFYHHGWKTSDVLQSLSVYFCILYVHRVLDESVNYLIVKSSCGNHIIYSLSNINK